MVGLLALLPLVLLSSPVYTGSCCRMPPTGAAGAVPDGTGARSDDEIPTHSAIS